MIGALKVLDSSGHTTYPLDTDENVEKAISQFNEQIHKLGSMAFDTSVTPGEQIKSYNPATMPDVTVVPMFQGG